MEVKKSFTVMEENRHLVKLSSESLGLRLVSSELRASNLFS